MIIWLDGVPGVGKTQITSILKEELSENVEILNSDYYFQKFFYELQVKASKAGILPAIQGTYPQSNKDFLNKFRELIESKIGEEKLVLVDMALTRDECKERLFDYFEKKKIPAIHIILEATDDNILNRIKSSPNRTLEFYEENISFLKNHYSEAIRVNTNSFNEKEVAKEVFNIIKENSLNKQI